MEITSIKYWVEMNDKGTPKIVPHDAKKGYLFLIRKPAEKFLKNLRKSNPNSTFRLVICKVTNTYLSWE